MKIWFLPLSLVLIFTWPEHVMAAGACPNMFGHLEETLSTKYFQEILPKNPQDSNGLVISTNEVGLSPGAVIEAYRNAAFPWNPTSNGEVKWYNPPQHGYIELEPIVLRTGKVFKNLRAVMNKAEKNGWTVSFNRAFDEVIQGCAEHYRQNYSHVWLTSEVMDVFKILHRQGWAHSVEVWDANGDLIGGTYGLYIDGVFSAESMFNHNMRTKEMVSDAGKFAVLSLSDLLYHTGHKFIDPQTVNNNTITNYKAIAIAREDYMSKRAEEFKAFIERGSIIPFPAVDGFY